MKILKKIYQIINKSKSKKNQQADVSVKQPTEQPTNVDGVDTQYLYPITTRIMSWLDETSWRYEHRPLGQDSRVHYLVLGFADKGHEWDCVFRICEKSQVVVILGILRDSIPVSHYASVLMAIAKVNSTINYGHLELDPTCGDVQVKLTFDTEFTHITNHMLNCHIQVVAAMTELARGVVKEIMQDDNPSQLVSDFIEIDIEGQDEMVIDDIGSFFLPTHVRQ